MLTKIDPKLIRTDLGTHVRVKINDDAVKDYAEAMEAGNIFPPLLVYYDEPNNRYILVDGFHRLAVHCRLHPNEAIGVKLELGTLEEARWASCRMNTNHGLRHTNANKRNLVKHALQHPKGANLSDREIGTFLGVAPKTVAAVRRELNLSREIP
ncbi:MAG: hypothetical protein LBP87_13025 [Planctomycetaceae bacterium]|jgi:hypothetical protein|nr:hypothetical protein [Planctomycetaceae bacterium]